MASRSIAFSLLLALAACGGPNTNTNDDGPAPGQGKIVKVTYLRFHIDERSRKPVPEYRVMLSSSWKAKYGESPNDPFSSLYRRGSRSPFLGEVPDEKMEQLIRELDRHGIAKLRGKDPESVDRVMLQNAEKDVNEATFTRVITVGDEKGSRSYLYRDNQLSEDTIRAFTSCEKEVIKMAIQYTAQVSVGSSPVTPRGN